MQCLFGFGPPLQDGPLHARTHAMRWACRRRWSIEAQAVAAARRCRLSFRWLVTPVLAIWRMALNWPRCLLVVSVAVLP